MQTVFLVGTAKYPCKFKPWSQTYDTPPPTHTHQSTLKNMFKMHIKLKSSCSYCNAFSFSLSREHWDVFFFWEIQGLFISKALGLLHKIKYQYILHQNNLCVSFFPPLFFLTFIGLNKESAKSKQQTRSLSACGNNHYNATSLKMFKFKSPWI